MTLSDTDIRDAMAHGQLIKNGDAKQLSGACYELRLGNVYYDLTESDHPIKLTPGQDALIKPGHRVVLITHEELDVPEDVVTRIASKGSLFSIGLSPVATYADPGFSGNIGIVTQNISNKYILLPQLEPIAKADFTKLTTPAERPYLGQHGFRTQIWPIKHQLQKSYKEIAKDPRVRSEQEEGYLLLPHATAAVIRRLEKRRIYVDSAILFAVLFNALIIFMVGNEFLTNIQGLIGNLVASAITGIFVFSTRRIG
ncbi:hypothetical protein OWM54_23800 [Myxococcus sp. MISCRS1]|uniref:dCTP deaminase domain-containing protein n=1 Tax=Myxococcus sp. MISCRS1 TaxID=2996786 RepID=UPI0022712154|nr:hypothetical protein [Myxococcus sp. MISCRS1]MCY1000167.1 hypothetical protein [Myxococcus sp. MISCRS1]